MRFDEHTMSKFEIDINDMTCTYFNREPNISNAYKSLLLAKFSLLFGLILLSTPTCRFVQRYKTGKGEPTKLLKCFFSFDFVFLYFNRRLLEIQKISTYAFGVVMLLPKLSSK